MSMLQGSGPHHVHSLWDVREEVGNAPALLDVVLRVGFQCVHHVRELHAVADEEHWEVISHQVPVSLTCVKLDLQNA